MSSLIELVEQVSRGDDPSAGAFAAYQQSANSAERFLAYHAGATLGLRQSHAHLQEALRAIEFADRKVLEQYVGLCSFLGREAETTGPTVKFGRVAVGRGEVAIGLEAASSAAALDLGRAGAWSRERGNWVELSDLYRRAAEARARPAGGSWSNGQPHVGYVVSALGDDEPAARAAATLAGHVDRNSYRLNVYATDGFARRDAQQWAGFGGESLGLDGRSAHRSPAATSWINNGAGARPTAARPSAAVSARIREAGCGQWTAPTDGDVVTAAEALARQLAADQTDVLIVDADATDPVAGLVASWGVVERVLWIARRRPLYADCVDAVCYLDPAVAEADRSWWGKRGIEPSVLVEGLDPAADAEQPAPPRSRYGIPDSAVIFAAAADDVAGRVGPAMVEGVIGLLRSHPQAVFLLIGAGETAALRQRFEAAGFGRRVGYAGRRRDLGAFLKMADAYLCPFGGSDASPASAAETIAAMAAGLPIVAANDASGVSAPAGPDVVAEDAPAWAERANRLARDPALRRKVGSALRRRAEQDHGFKATAGEIEAIVARLANDGQSFAEPAAEQKKAA